MTIRFDTPGLIYFDRASQAPLIGAHMYFYKHNDAALTLQSTYKDPGLTVANENPVPLNADGTLPAVWLQAVDYHVRLLNAADVQQFDELYVSGVVQAPENIYNNATTYALEDKIKASDNFWYVSLANNNTGHDPSGGSNATFWTRYREIRLYNSSEVYSEYMLVQNTSGYIFSSLVNNNIGNTPPASSFWESIVDVSSSGETPVGGVFEITAAGDKTVTVGFAPKIVYFFGMGAVAGTDLSFTVGAAPGRTTGGTGVTTGTCMGIRFHEATPVIDTYTENAKCFELQLGSGSSPDIYSTIWKQWETDGFTVTTSLSASAPSLTQQIYYLAFG